MSKNALARGGEVGVSAQNDRIELFRYWKITVVIPIERGEIEEIKNDHVYGKEPI